MFGFSSSQRYHIAPESLDSDSEKDHLIDGQVDKPTGSWPAVPVLLVAVIVLVTAGIAVPLGVWVGRHTNLNNICTRHTAGNSPMLDDLDITYQTVQFDGRFVKSNVYREEPPSPDVDAAWEALGVGYQQVIVPDELASSFGLTKNHTRRNPKYGGGYPVFVEGLHQLHCLNLVRKSLYYNYDYYLAQNKSAFADPPEVLHWHVSHCVDFIRQRLMCSMDIGVFGSVWVDRKDPRPFVDFNTKHTCRDFEQIRRWAESHQVDENLPMDFLEMPSQDVYVWDAAP